jgi:hypothetical protein
MTIDAPPYSRWLLQESVDHLAASHDAAVAAVAALARSAVGYGGSAPPPALGPRLAGRRGGSRTAWLGGTALGTALFLAWLSARLVRHLAAAPVTVAVLPGALLALALAVTAAHAAGSGEGDPECGLVPVQVVLPWVLFAAAVAGVVAWISLALTVTAGVAPWTAFACGAALACGVAATTLVLARPVRPAIVVVPRSRPVPRRLRAKRRRAEQLLRRHARQWNQAAQHYGVALADAGPAARVLARLLAGDADLSLERVEPYDILILKTLHRYRPALLAEHLENAVRPIEGASMITKTFLPPAV